jgi:hypothetical protein
MPPVPPNSYGPLGNTGEGPVNYQNRTSDPFSQMDSYISYQNMVRQQQVDQYQQAFNLPPPMSQRQMFRALTGSRYQQGVDATARENMYRMYQRRNEMQREVYSAKLASEAVQWGGFAALAPAFGAMAGGGLLGIGAGLIGPGIAMAPMAMSIDKELQRREFAMNLSSDLDLYRRRIGGNFSYQQNTMLGRQLQREMYRGEFARPGAQGDFFNPLQQMQIMKTGLATGLLTTQNQDVGRMLTERGGRLDIATMGAINQGGTTQQFQKNFSMLRDTTRDVVKLLQTTLEGGMSVIKELQQTGFRSIGDIRTQVLQAKAFGDITGVGAQNMMLIGRAGAQAVQGTSWSGAAGATMYQQAATTAALQSQINPMMARAVERAGGIGQAGAALAGAQMNMLSSGMGTRVVASVLRPDGSINPEMMNRMRSGGMSAYEITSRAGAVGYAMGPGGRAMFDLTRQRALESMSDMDRQMLTQQAFNAWRGNKQGNAEQQAYVYAGMWTNNPAERELLMQNLITPKQYAQQWAGLQAQRGGLNAAVRPRYMNPIARGFTNAMIDVGQAGAAFGEGFVDAAGVLGKAAQSISRGTRSVWYGVNTALEIAAHGGQGGEYGWISRTPNVNTEAVLNKYYNVGRQFTGAERNALEKTSIGTAAAIAQKYRINPATTKEFAAWGVDLNKTFNKLSGNQYNLLTQELAGYATGSMGTASLAQSFGPNGVLGMLGIKQGSDVQNYLFNRGFEKRFAAGALVQLQGRLQGETGLSTEATSRFSVYAAQSKNGGADALLVQQLSNKFMGSNLGFEALQTSVYKSLGTKSNAYLIAGAVAASVTQDKNKAKNLFIPDYTGQTWDEQAAARATTGAISTLRAGISAAKNVNYTGGSQFGGIALPSAAERNYGNLLKAFGGDTVKMLQFTRDATSLDPQSLQQKYGTLISGQAATLGHSTWTDAKQIQWSTLRDMSSSVQTYAGKTNVDKVIKAADEEAYVRGRSLAESRADTYSAYYKRTGLGNITDKERTMLSAVFGYSTSSDVSGINSKDLQSLATKLMKGEGFTMNTAGMNPDKLMSALHDKLTLDKTGLSGSVLANTALTNVQKEIREVASSFTRVNGKWLDKDGKTPLGEGEVTKRLAQTETLQKQASALQISTPNTIADANASNTGQMNANVSPAVLNYWNNRWVL